MSLSAEFTVDLTISLIVLLLVKGIGNMYRVLIYFDTNFLPLGID